MVVGTGGMGAMRAPVRAGLLACALFLPSVWAGAQAPAAQAPALSPPLSATEIQVPSVTPRWKRPGDPEAREVSIDDVERCIGQDLSMRAEIEQVRQQQGALEAERTALGQRSSELGLTAKAISETHAALQARVQRLTADNESLRTRRELIDTKRASGVHSPDALKAFNAQVEAYNADLSQLRQRQALLQKEQDAFNQTVAAYNQDAARANETVARFNERKEAFQKQAADLARRSGAYAANCTGERVLRK